MERRNILNWILALSTLTVATGCAPLTEDARTTSVIQAATPTFPTGSASSAQGVATQTVSALSGTYQATLVGYDSRGSVASQAMTIAIRKVTSAQTGESWFYGVFSSNGALGSVSFETYLGLGLSGYYNTFSLTTPAITLSNLSSGPIAIQLALQLSASGAQVDPTQSRISVLDCGIAQYLGCGTRAEDVWFANSQLSKL